ncbi:MAG: hypothetical protein ABIW16_04075 [Sphingomicrobium sp.]
MRHILLTATLFLSACATVPPPVAPTPVSLPQSPHIRSDLLGMTATELVQRFGTPALTVREGAGLKLQFRARACVLDAYLYPTGAAPERVAHVDARLPSGADTDQFACIAALGAP